MKVTVRQTKKAAEELSSVDTYSLLVTADQKADDLLMFYSVAAEELPQYKQFFDTVIADVTKHKGYISEMRKALQGDDSDAFAEGEAEAKQMLDTPLSVGGSFITDCACPDCKEDYFANDNKIVSLIVDSSAREAYEDDGADEYIVLAKESKDPEEAFLEYRYVDELQALSSFSRLDVPAALLKKDGKGQWYIQAQTPDCGSLLDILDEQISLLNS